MRARQRIRTWNGLLTEVAEQHLPDMGIELPPALLVPAFAAFWYGMEQQHLIGMSETETPFFEILERVGDWIEEREQAGTRAVGDGNREQEGRGKRQQGRGKGRD